MNILITEIMQAISEYIKVMQTDRERYQQFRERGKYFARLGKDQSAIQDFISQNFMITISNLAQYLRGLACADMNKTQDAIEDFTQILNEIKFKYAYWSPFQDQIQIYSYPQLIKHQDN